MLQLLKVPLFLVPMVKVVLIVLTVPVVSVVGAGAGAGAALGVAAVFFLRGRNCS